MPQLNRPFRYAFEGSQRGIGFIKPGACVRLIAGAQTYELLVRKAGIENVFTWFDSRSNA